jgi:hypothetical protein
MSTIFQAPLAILILLKGTVELAVLLYVFVIYPKPAKTGFYSRSTGGRLWFVAAIMFFPFFILYVIFSLAWKLGGKLRRFADE